MDKRCQIFLAYARDDSAVAAAVAKGLASAGWQVSADFDIDPGTPVVEALDRMIRASDLYIVLVSPALENSQSLGLFELGFILAEQRERGAITIPVVVRDFGVVPLPSYARQSNAIDARGWQIRDIVDRLATAIAQTDASALLLQA